MTNDRNQGKVFFIGAGPGDPELMTVKGARLIARADLVLYAGSLVPPASVAEHKKGAKVLDSAPMTLEQTHALLMETVNKGGLAARVHTGDPSLYGAIREQTRLLDRDGAPWEIVPGVTVAFAAAARAGVSFTVPGRCQSLTITRVPGKTSMTKDQDLAAIAATGGAMAVYLSSTHPETVRDQLLQAGLAPDTRIVAAHRVGWPDENVFETTVQGLPADVAEHGITGQAVFLILPGEDDKDHLSHLYHPDHSHKFRKAED